jgi:hypothetical protein
MGKIREPVPMKLICGLLGRETGFEKARQSLVAEFGSIDYESPFVSFDQTDYYAREMGADLSRAWVSFERLVHPGELSEVKLITNRLEMEFSGPEGHRTVNLDPGLLDESKLILASTKNYSHRIYLAQGIYAEVTLVYRQGAFRDLAWTYPDYRENVRVFEEIRGILREQRGE